MEKIGVIVVGGAGVVATGGHIPSWLKNPRVNVLALVDPNEEKVKGICHSFGIEKYYTSLEEALDKEKRGRNCRFSHTSKISSSLCNIIIERGKACHNGKTNGDQSK